MTIAREPTRQVPGGHQHHPDFNVTDLELSHSDSRWVCRFCESPITHRSDQIDFCGGHVHVFTNPHGYRYRIGCFAMANGALIEGEPTAEHSWFPEHRWQVALCHGCTRHLGWYFSNGTNFFGLILANLIEAKA